MSAKLEEEPVISIPGYFVPRGEANDEVRLIDVLDVVSRQKKLVFLALLVCLLLAVGYCFIASPVYRSVMHLLPPKTQDIQVLKIDYGSGSVDRFTPEIVYKVFLENLNSRRLRRRYFDQSNIVAYFTNGEGDEINADQIFDEQFNAKLNINVDKNNLGVVTISMRYRDATVAAEWLNQFVRLVDRETIQQFVGEISSALEFELGQIGGHLESKLKLAKQRRDDIKTRLLEALVIATSMGIIEAGFQPSDSRNQSTGLMVNTAQIPLYMRGTRALETEIAVLDKRKSDKPFISGYRDLEERQAFLEGVSISTEKLSAFTLDAAASIPYRIEKPRKLLVILLGGIVGLIVGLSLAFARDSTKNIS